MASTENSTTRSRRRASGVILSYTYSLAQLAVGLLYVPVLTRGLGSSEYGLYQLIGAVIASMSILNTTFAGGVTRFYCKYYSSDDTEGMENTLAISRGIYQIVAVVAIIIGLVVIVLFRPIYGDKLTNAQVTEGMVMIGVLVANLIVTMNNTIHVAVINAHERFSFLKATQLTVTVSQPVIVLILIHFWPYALTVSLVQLTLNIVLALSQRIYARRILGARLVRHEDKDHLVKSLLKFSAGILLAMIADQIFWNSNKLILGYYFDMTVVAVYSIASQISMYYMPIGTAIANVFMPRVSELYFKNGDLEAISALFVRAGRIALYPLLLILLGFIVFGREFIDLWVGDAYLPAYGYTLALIIPFTVDIDQNLGLIILQVMDRYYFRGFIYLTIAIISIIVVFIGAPFFGAMGAALTTGICMVIGSGVLLNIYYARIIGLDIGAYWKGALRVTIPLAIYAGIAYGIVHGLGFIPNGWLTLAASLLVFTAGYFIVAYFASMNTNERRLVNRLAGGITKTFRKELQNE